jgi:hypothetical protein
VQGKKIIVGPLCVVKLDIDIDIAALRGITRGKGTEDADTPCSETVNLVEPLSNYRQWIYHTDKLSPAGWKHNIDALCPLQTVT